MALTESEKAALFSKARLETIQSIWDRHQRLGYRMWGWAKNKVRQVTGATTVSKGAMAANLAVTGIAKLVSQFVAIGPIIGAVGQAAVNAARNHELYSRMCASKDPNEKLDFSREYMVDKGAEAVSDAIRKLNDAAVDAKSKANFKNCTEFAGMLEAVYYYNYRLQRLMYYNGLMKNYASMLDEKLQTAHRDWAALEKELEKQAPRHWDDWQWHTRNCTDGYCLFPYDKLEISSPQLVSTTANLQAMGLRPIAPKPGPPPIPPRPQFKK